MSETNFAAACQHSQITGLAEQKGIYERAECSPLNEPPQPSPAMQRAFDEIERSAITAAIQMRDHDLNFLRKDKWEFRDKVRAVLCVSVAEAAKMQDAEILTRCKAALARAQAIRTRDQWAAHWAGVIISVVSERGA